MTMSFFSGPRNPRRAPEGVAGGQNLLTHRLGVQGTPLSGLGVSSPTPSSRSRDLTFEAEPAFSRIALPGTPRGPCLLSLCSVEGCVLSSMWQSSPRISEAPALSGGPSVHAITVFSLDVGTLPTKMTLRVGPSVTGVCPQAQAQEIQSAASGRSLHLICTALFSFLFSVLFLFFSKFIYLF